jgi:tetratricopeptide (TPR) repeat protein
MSRIWSVTILVIVSCSYSAVGTAAGGGSMKAPNVERRSPDQLAIESYNAGLRHRDKAWRHQEKVAASTRERDRTKYQRRANKEFAKAAKRYRAAIEYQPELYQAHASLGYGLKEMGEFDTALKAYAESLASRPQYTPAIEYLAETHLPLGEVDKATAAYSQLVELDPVKSDELLAAINDWLANPPENTSPDAIKKVSDWLRDSTGS